MSELKKGDRVKVAFEAQVYDSNPSGVGIQLPGDYSWWISDYIEGVNVEKIEPPVERFKPGDVVRSKQGWDRAPRALGDTGYIRLAGEHSEFYEYGPAKGAYELSEFTSNRFERVELP